MGEVETLRADPTFTTGVSELVVLRLLSNREMYGYELIKVVRLSTSESFKLGEGVLYPLLHSLEARGLLKSRRKLTNGRTRVYYFATAKGRRRLTQLTTQWQRVATAINAALEDGRYA
jgi:PadR family transcriptional regulator, regulatory protein PadR